MPVIQAIMISEAAIIVENAFRDVLGFDDEALAKLSSQHKFELYCDYEQLKLMFGFIRTDGSGGLPSMSPPRTILIEVFKGIKTTSKVETLIDRVSDNAYYEIP
jgi:hypothetical protein